MDEKYDNPLAFGEAVLEVKQCLGCMHEGLVVTTLDGVIVECTPAADHIQQTPSLVMKGRSIHEFCLTPDIYKDLQAQAVKEVRVLNRSLVVTSGTGKRKLVNMSIQCSAASAPARLVHVFQDCADLRTMEDRFLQSERLATIARFASQIAHEIRNPLNSISLNVELLQDELRDSNDEARGLIRSVLGQLDRLNEIVGEYLQFARFPKPHL